MSLQKRLKSSHVAAAVVLIALILGFQNCGGVKFTPALSNSISSTGNNANNVGLSCSTVLQNTQQNLRIIFMVDNSGSTDTTDPKHYYRVQTLSNFIAQYGTKSNFTYNLGYFAGSAYQFDVSHQAFSAAPKTPFGTSADLGTGLNILANTSTASNTNYGIAFNAIQKIISDDPVVAVPWAYVVVFMSDGMPTDIQNNVDSTLIGLVDSLKSAATKKGSLLTMSSVYFGPEGSASAIDHLQVIAQEGGGQFVDTNQRSGGSLSIDDVITVPGQVCQ